MAPHESTASDPTEEQLKAIRAILADSPELLEALPPVERAVAEALLD